MTCVRCGCEIGTERAGQIAAGWLCEACLDGAERCAPREDYAINGISSGFASPV